MSLNMIYDILNILVSAFIKDFGLLLVLELYWAPEKSVRKYSFVYAF